MELKQESDFDIQSLENDNYCDDLLDENGEYLEGSPQKQMKNVK